ncbi:mite allergen Eur m 3-like [Zophobas morio]|uniref:mite allergen Eur m 3-like n=1 Tax=Zophobas morio TaxID=2755281 RepID=UPI0030835846
MSRSLFDSLNTTVKTLKQQVDKETGSDKETYVTTANGQICRYFLSVLIVCISTLAEPLVDRIFGGQLATLGQFPSIVSIKTGPGIIGHVCGASIITKQWVATAAHCVSDSTPDDIFLLADTLLLDSGGTNYSVSSIVVHPEYYRYTYTNDIALIKLQTEFTLSATTQTIEICTSPGNESCTIVGW